MANRFTDSGKWDDPWFRKLPCKYKAFWIFILDKCNHAGIWKVDFESASFHIGETITSEDVLLQFSDRIYPFKDKWFITKFIFFQYGILSKVNRVHNSVIEILKKEGLYKVYERSIEGCKDKDKDKDKDKGKGKDKDKDIIIAESKKTQFDGFWNIYPDRNGKKLYKAEAEEFFLKKIKDEDIPEVLQAARNYAVSQNVTDGIGIKDAIRFLKKNYWREWITPEKVAPKGKTTPPEPTGRGNIIVEPGSNRWQKKISDNES